MLAEKSTSAITACSTSPRKCAARKPSDVPTSAPMMVAPKAISRLVRIE